jgi:hypothetical protein
MRTTGMTPAAMAAQLRTLPGMSPNMAHLLTQEPGEFARIMRSAQAQAPTQASIDAAQRATEAMANLANATETLTRAFIIAIEGPVGEFFRLIAKIVGYKPVETKETTDPFGFILKGSFADRFIDYMAGRRKQIGRTQAEIDAQEGRTPAPEPSALRVKPGAGLEGTHAGMRALAADLHSIPGFNRITAGNDQFHKGRPSAHSRGLALDFTVSDKAQAAAAAEQVRQKLRAMGINATVIDEYSRPSPFSTGGHIHVQFATEADAARYAASRAGRPGAGSAASAASLGAQAGAGVTNTSEVNIGEITINDSSGNPDANARGIRGAIENVGLAASVNTGLQ